MSLCIVMPAYNEEGGIEPVVLQWLQILNKYPGILIIVNDGSTDKTGEILNRIAKVDNRLKVVNQSNQGHGAAILKGYSLGLESGANWIFQTDSDNQFQAFDFPKLWNLRGQSPFILGSREVRLDAFHRKIISLILHWIVYLFFGSILKDINVPFRLMRADFVRALLLHLPEQALTPNIFLTILAKRAGAELFHLPTAHQKRQTGKVSILRFQLLKFCIKSTIELWHFRRSVVHLSLDSLELKFNA